SLSESRPKLIPDMEYRAIFSRAPARVFLLCPNFAPNSFPIWNIARSFRGRRHEYSFFVRISPQTHSRYGISRDLFEGAGTSIPSLSEFRPKLIPDMEYRAIFSRPPARVFLLCPNFAPNSFPIWNIARSFRGRRHEYSFFVRISPQTHSRYGISRDLFEAAGTNIPSLSEFLPKLIPDMQHPPIFSRPP